MSSSTYSMSSTAGQPSGQPTTESTPRKGRFSIRKAISSALSRKPKNKPVPQSTSLDIPVCETPASSHADLHSRLSGQPPSEHHHLDQQSGLYSVTTLYKDGSVGMR